MDLDESLGDHGGGVDEDNNYYRSRDSEASTASSNSVGDLSPETKPRVTLTRLSEQVSATGRKINKVSRNVEMKSASHVHTLMLSV